MMKLFTAITYFIFYTSSFSNDGCVTVYIWNSELSGGDHYGHVSLKTQNSYVSLWPSDRNRIDIPDVGCLKATAVLNENYEQDVRDEKRAADTIYSVNIGSRAVSLIDNEWHTLSQRDLMWFALGTNLDTRKIVNQFNDQQGLREHVRSLYTNPYTFNCASIVYHLLTTKGGLYLSGITNGVGCPHNSMVQSFIFTAVTGNTNGDFIDKVVKNEPFFEKIIYPDKVGYMLRNKIVDDMARVLGYTQLALDEDHIWNNILNKDGTNFNDPNTRALFKTYLDKKWKDSPLSVFDGCVIA